MFRDQRSSRSNFRKRLFSVVSELNNEIRDFEVDKKTNILTSAVLLGKRRAILLRNALAIMAVAVVVITVYIKRGLVVQNFEVLLGAVIGISILYYVMIKVVGKRLI